MWWGLSLTLLRFLLNKDRTGRGMLLSSSAGNVLHKPLEWKDDGGGRDENKPYYIFFQFKTQRGKKNRQKNIFSKDGKSYQMNLGGVEWTQSIRKVNV